MLSYRGKKDSLYRISKWGRVISLLLFSVYNVVLLSILACIYESVGILVVGTIGLEIVCISSYNKNNSQKLYYVLSIAITISIVFMLLNYYGLIEEYGEPYYANDDKSFENYGRIMYLEGIFNYRDVPQIASLYYAKGYLVIISWIYRLSGGIAGYHTMSPRVLNLYLWLSVATLVYKLLKEKVEERYAIIAMFALSIFPNGMYISSFVYRDSLVCFLLYIGFYNFYRIFEKRLDRLLLIRIVLVFYSVYALYYIRVHIVFVFMALALVLILFEIGKNKSIVKRYCICGIAIGSVFVMLFVTNGWDLFIRTLTGYSAYTLTLSDGLSNYVFAMPVMPFGWILRIIYGFMVPFPGGILKLDYLGKPLFSLIKLLVQMGTIFQMFLIPYVFKSMKKIDTYAVLWGICYMAVVMTTFTFRHFIMMYPMLTLCVVPEYVRTNRSKRKKNMIYVILLLICCVNLYAALKMVL